MSPPSDRSLITGVTGFAGRHLARRLVESGEMVAGYALAASPGSGDGLDEVEVLPGDIRDADRIAEVIEHVRPSRIYHLAALSHVGRSWNRRSDTLDVNLLGTAALLEAVARTQPGMRILLVSTGQVYGYVEESDMPLAEGRRAKPTSPYAASKLCAEVVALQAAAAGEVEIVVARPFNFAGPGQAPSFVCSDFARQVARAEAGLAAPRIAVGNLQARRDFTDVRDMVRGFDLIARQARSGEVFNLCSGRGVSIESLLASLLGMSRVQIEVIPDPGRMRPVDVPIYIGDGTRARERLDWQPSIALESTLADTLEYWRRQIALNGDAA